MNFISAFLILLTLKTQRVHPAAQSVLTWTIVPVTCLSTVWSRVKRKSRTLKTYRRSNSKIQLLFDMNARKSNGKLTPEQQRATKIEEGEKTAQNGCLITGAHYTENGRF